MNPDPWSLADKVTVITGGSRGLGLAISEAFAAHGAQIVVASRKADACAAVAGRLGKTYDVRAAGVGFHAGRWEDCEELVDYVYDEFGRCDVLVNNAGMSPLYASLPEVTEELFDKVIGVNFKGPFRLTALVGQRMAAANGGSIINISSISAVRPQPHDLVYASSKAALNALTVGFARAYAPTVRCNAIMAGPFYTDVARAWDAELIESFARDIPLGRGAEPVEITGAALYLASAASSYTNGAVIKVDGGMAFAAA